MNRIEFLSRFLFLWSWQAAIVIGATWLIHALDRFRSPVVRYRIWFAGLATVCALMLWNFAVIVLPLPLSRPTPTSILVIGPVGFAAR
jgi:hypothetical protein